MSKPEVASNVESEVEFEVIGSENESDNEAVSMMSTEVNKLEEGVNAPAERELHLAKVNTADGRVRFEQEKMCFSLTKYKLSKRFVPPTKLVIPAVFGHYWESGGFNKDYNQGFATLVCDNKGRRKSARAVNYNCPKCGSHASVSLYKGDYITFTFSKVRKADRISIVGFFLLGRVTNINKQTSMADVEVCLFKEGPTANFELPSHLKHLRELVDTTFQKRKEPNCDRALFVNPWGLVTSRDDIVINFNGYDNVTIVNDLKTLEDRIKKEGFAKSIKTKVQIFDFRDKDCVSVFTEKENYKLSNFPGNAEIRNTEDKEVYLLKLYSDDDVVKAEECREQFLFGASNIEELRETLQIISGQKIGCPVGVYAVLRQVAI